MKRFASLALLLTAFAVAADVKIEELANRRFRVLWNGKAVILPGSPRLANRGGGTAEFYDPTVQQMRKMEISPEEAALRVLNKHRDRVALGKPVSSFALKDGKLTCLEKYPNADAFWKVELVPVEGDGLDVTLEVGVSPNFWIEGFNFDLFRLAIPNGVADSGQLRSRIARQPRPEFPPPVSGNVTIVYPHGPECYVPAAVIQGDGVACGVAQLDVHNVWRHDISRLDLVPNAARTTYSVSLEAGWANYSSFGNFYRHAFKAHYRFRFGEPLPAGPAGYVTMVDGKALWRDYMAELDKEMPVRSPRRVNPDRNNILICHYFTSEEIYITPENPMGYLMMSPNWKDDRWEWGYEKINSKMSNEEIKKRTGLGDENAGPPVKWVKPMAERLVREALETKAQAVIVMKSGTHPQVGELNYIPESHVFHPLLEERNTIEGAVREWDWARGSFRLFDPSGKLVAQGDDLAIHAADKDDLIPFNRGNRARQEFFIHETQANADFEPFKGKFSISPKHIYTLKDVGGFETLRPQKPLLGKKPGDKAEITVLPLSWNPGLRDRKFKLELTLRSVERAAIDIWAKTVTDSDTELGFLVREDLTAGPPWFQFNLSLDWGNDWQYQIIKQRIQYHRIRFGEKCRWFYFDVFGDWTPSFVFAMLSRDFPDCFFFVEHPNDVADRVVNGWKWFGEKTELEKFVAPQSIGTVVFDRLLTYDRAKDRARIGKMFNHPNYMLNTHRGARQIIKLMQEKE